MKAQWMTRLVGAAVIMGCIAPVLAQPVDAKKPTPTPAATPAQPAKPATPAPAQPGTDKPAGEKPAAPAVEKVSWVELKTSMGTIVLEVDGEHAPISAENFLKYVSEGYYDGTVFHRVIKDFMVQGGGFDANISEKKTGQHAPIKNEWKNGLKNTRGTVAMARTQVADSATSQFFINLKDNAFLDQARDGAAYAVFGKVVSGMDVVDKIAAVATGNKNNMRDVPTTNVTIEKARKLTKEEADKAKVTPAPAPEAPKADAPKADAPKSGGGK
jgi:cyclophilin family peptidyl-prolyl cis-trans isomerase